MCWYRPLPWSSRFKLRFEIMPCGHELALGTTFWYNVVYPLYNCAYAYTNIHRNIYQLILTTSVTNEYTSLYKYKSLTLSFRKGYVCCVWEMIDDKDGLLYWLNFFLAHSSTTFESWLGFLKRWSLRVAKPSGCKLVLTLAFCLQLTQTVRVPGNIIFERPPASAVLPLITQVHLLIDGSVEGQYKT